MLVVDTSHPPEKRLAWFSERLRMDLKLSPYEDICEVDMLFFPILRRGHYFLLCLDFPRFRYEIIDNDSNPKAKALKYGDCIEDLLGMLSKFFEVISPPRSTACVCVESKRLQMPWRDSKNKVDCGVFLMRHMESYVGQRVRDWECGLLKGDTHSLHKLRLRYMSEIVISVHNVHRQINLSWAYQSISAPLPPV
ncbi:PREDICTED: uncharacterized protein LOC109146919 [Ipomoea nil]|uniref:uncharacterized protein LOC109146919 n=1 Tax=Ipomoea nil TaxID=35883 RepID=UPI0009009977|nr:PREDICTED: uncharacterized protein LOC109146919 [Ipomoea nil]